MPTTTGPISPAHRGMLHHPCHWASAIVFILSAAPCSPAIAGDNATPAEVEARYKSERAACDGRQSMEDRATCLREAAAAHDAARRGQLDNHQEDVYARNALARCDALPQADRDLCLRRARGEGTMTGSVSEGGILREYREITLTPPQDGAEAGGAAGESSAANAPENMSGVQKQGEKTGRDPAP